MIHIEIEAGRKSWWGAPHGLPMRCSPLCEPLGSIDNTSNGHPHNRFSPALSGESVPHSEVAVPIKLQIVTDKRRKIKSFFFLLMILARLYLFLLPPYRIANLSQLVGYGLEDDSATS